MKKIVGGTRLIIKCCKLYYEESFTQNEIAKILGISRPTVSRLLSEGKEKGIVRIEIINSLEKNYNDLERIIEKKYGMKEVIIIEDETEELIQKRRASKKAAEYLDRILKTGDKVGVSMGTTIKEIANYINTTEKSKLTFLPLIGGVGQTNIEIHPNQITMDLARAFGAEFKLLHAPVLVTNIDIKNEFLKEKSISEILDYGKKCNVGIVGIGSPKDKNSTMMGSGYFYEKDLIEFQRNGIVGDVCLQFYDINGISEKFSEHNQRIIGTNLEDLKRIDTVIGVACGEDKVNGIIGALQGKYINVLITNFSNAKLISEYNMD